jgi:hypothetical protein
MLYFYNGILSNDIQLNYQIQNVILPSVNVSLLDYFLLNVVLLNIVPSKCHSVLLNYILLNVIVQNVVLLKRFMSNVILLNFDPLNVILHYIVFLKCPSLESKSTKCRSSECRGAFFSPLSLLSIREMKILKSSVLQIHSIHPSLKTHSGAGAIKSFDSRN